jgi:hypothetical protein
MSYGTLAVFHVSGTDTNSQKAILRKPQPDFLLVACCT